MESSGIENLLYQLLTRYGMDPFWATCINNTTVTLALLVLSYFLFLISKRILNTIFHRLARNSKTTFDDILVANHIPKIIAYLPPLFFLISFLPGVVESFTGNETVVLNVLEALSVLIVILLVRSLLHSLKDYLKLLPTFKDKPIDSYIQVFMIFIWFVGSIIILSLLTGKNVATFLTTLGALSAIILLIFKDSILGFVASIQVTINDTVRIGDWITMKNASADGDVIEINLSTVKVQNFDNTITSIPTYKLVSDSFVNWRGMSESGGRRIKRALLIKVKSIRFLTENELTALEKIERVADYIRSRKENIDQYNNKKQTNKSLLINGRNMTNLGLFRQYTEAYLKEHPEINHDMTLMCRQLAPTAQGLPLEIYVFTRDKVWVNYERIMADVFDHLLASMPFFHLEFFEFSATVLDR